MPTCEYITCELKMALTVAIQDSQFKYRDTFLNRRILKFNLTFGDLNIDLTLATACKSKPNFNIAFCRCLNLSIILFQIKLFYFKLN